MKAIIGRKVGMSQIFDENGKVIPVTVIEAGPCVVVQKKTAEKDGYNAVQLGYEDIPERKLTKPEMGHLNKAGVAPKKYLREFDLENAAELNAGDIIKADTFKKGDFVDVTGTTIEISKTMSANPRRIGKIEIIFNMPDREFSEKEKTMIERAAHTLSLIHI